jgi:NDP-sugar pyrophosphorylase family protein
MILAAGDSQRLRPLTSNVPKPMLVIAGRPILEHNVRLLVRHGICDLIINLHHCAEAIRSYFADGSGFGARIRYSWEPVLLGTSGAVKRVAEEFRDTFLVVYGDNLTDCDLGNFMAHHQRKGGVATIALFHREDVTSSGIVEVDSEDRVLRFLEKPRPDEAFSHWVNAGLLALDPSILDSIPEGVSDFGREVLPSLIGKERGVYGYRMSEQLWWIDSPADYERTRQLVDESLFYPNSSSAAVR